MPSIVSRTQGAFVFGKSILHHILLCHDIVKMYKGGEKQNGCLILNRYTKGLWHYLLGIP